MLEMLDFIGKFGDLETFWEKWPEVGKISLKLDFMGKCDSIILERCCKCDGWIGTEAVLKCA